MSRGQIGSRSLIAPLMNKMKGAILHTWQPGNRARGLGAYFRAWSGATRPSERISGYTLIEMLVVLAIMGLIASIAAPRLQLSEYAKLRRRAAGIVSDIRTMRADAIRRGIRTSVVITRSGYELTPSHKMQEYSDGTHLSLQASPALYQAEKDALMFFPDGSSSGGALTISRGSSTADVRIRELNGQVSYEDGQ